MCQYLGSIVKLTYATGQEMFKASYDAWGRQINRLALFTISILK